MIHTVFDIKKLIDYYFSDPVIHITNVGQQNHASLVYDNFAVHIDAARILQLIKSIIR